MKRLRLPALALLPALAGCAATSGRDWVRAAEPGLFEDAGEYGDDGQAGALPTEPVVMTEPESAGPRRLSRTVSLGERDDAGGGAEVAPAAASGPVIVTVNNYVEAPYATPWGYGGFVYDDLPRDRGRRAAPPARASGTPGLGGDWPAPRDSGPAFPFKTAPASPWR